MSLQLLHINSHLTVYHDYLSDSLYLDWKGDLTLPTVQTCCVELANLVLARIYPRVIINNCQVASIGWGVPFWLAHKFFPGLSLAGVEQIAWVCATPLRGPYLMQIIRSRLPDLNIYIFDDVEPAVAWFRRTRTSSTGTSKPTRLPAAQLKLSRAVAILTWKTILQLAAHPYAAYLD